MIANGQNPSVNVATIRISEKYILGAMLKENTLINDLSRFLRKDDFHLPGDQELYLAIVEFYNSAKSVDLPSIANELHKRGQIENVGGYPYLAELWDACGSSANAAYHAKQVRDASMLRRLCRVAEEIGRDAIQPIASADETLASAERRILELSMLGAGGDTISLATAVNEASDRYDERATAGPTSVGVATGFLDLDHLTAGLQPSELIVIAARPSEGKTAILLTLLRNVIADQRPVFFASLEQSRIELAERLIASEGAINSHNWRRARMSPEEQDRAAVALRTLRKLPMHIDDWPVQSMIRIAGNARRLKLKYDIQLVAVDYLQLIDPEDKRVPRQEQVAAISRKLKQLARELKIPVVALAQLNRESENRPSRTPRISDLRESGSIEADADTILLLYRDAENDNLLNVKIDKQRNGPKGEFQLYFRKECVRFENYSQAQNM